MASVRSALESISKAGEGVRGAEMSTVVQPARKTSPIHLMRIENSPPSARPLSAPPRNITLTTVCQFRRHLPGRSKALPGFTSAGPRVEVAAAAEREAVRASRLRQLKTSEIEIVTAVESGRIARAAKSTLAPIQLLPEDERKLAASLMVGKAIIHGDAASHWIG